MSNPSGVKGLLGAIADTWDRIPIKGPMIAIVAALGAILAITSSGSGGAVCDTNPLHGVYHPQRLRIVQTCAEVTGTVVAYRLEHDGDYHVSMRMSEPGWTNAVNDRSQHGFTVVEFVPLMPRPKLRAGMRLKLTGTKVLDHQHGGWIELHPVFNFEDVTPPNATPEPNRPKLAPATEH